MHRNNRPIFLGSLYWFKVIRLDGYEKHAFSIRASSLNEAWINAERDLDLYYNYYTIGKGPMGFYVIDVSQFSIEQPGLAGEAFDEALDNTRDYVAYSQNCDFFGAIPGLLKLMIDTDVEEPGFIG